MPEINSYEDIAAHLAGHKCENGYDCLCHKCVCPGYAVVSRADNGVVTKVEQYLGRSNHVSVGELTETGSWILYARDPTSRDRPQWRPDSLEDLVRRAYDAGALALSGHLVNNGADYYFCPGCFARKDTMGYADTANPDLSDVDHKPNCPLVALVEAAKKL